MEFMAIFAETIAALALLQTAPSEIEQVDPAIPIDICVTPIRVLGVATLGSGQRSLEITLGQGVCPASDPGISELGLRYSNDDVSGDAVSAEHCPALAERSALLHRLPPRRSNLAQARTAGRYRIAGMTQFFEMRTVAGRRAAARWLTGTLYAVRPCWNNFRQDREQKATGDLYRRLARS
jgi:hypothetical protein